MLKIRRPLGRLIFNMGITIPGKTVFLIETAPWSCWYRRQQGRLHKKSIFVICSRQCPSGEGSYSLFSHWITVQPLLPTNQPTKLHQIQVQSVYWGHNIWNMFNQCTILKKKQPPVSSTRDDKDGIIAIFGFHWYYRSDPSTGWWTDRVPAESPTIQEQCSILTVT